MWGEQFAGPGSALVANNNLRVSKSAPSSPIKPNSNGPGARVDPFHVVHKVPMGDSPYVKAKHVQLVDKDPDRAIALFWAAINSGDRVDSALKDMAIVMKQQNRPQEAIEAIKSLRSRCSDQAQESLDNVLLDLFKRCGRLDDQIELLKRKLHLIHQGMAFNGKRTKTARSQGKKFQVSVEQEATRLLGNLGWAYMQQSNFVAAEAVYRKALSIESDNNKACNLGICLMKQGRLDEAKSMLQSVTLACHDSRWASESHLKSFERAQEMLDELEKGYHDGVEEQQASCSAVPGWDAAAASGQADPSSLWQPQPALPRQPRRNARSSPELQLAPQLAVADPWLTGALLATSGFGPAQADAGSAPQGVANCSSPDRGGCVRSVQPGPSVGEGSFQSQWWLQGGLEGEDLLDYTSPDESSDGSVDGQVGGQRDLFTAFDNVGPKDGQAAGKAESETSTCDSDGSEFSSAIRNLARSLESVQPFSPIAVHKSPIVQPRTPTTQDDAVMTPGSDGSGDNHLPLTPDLASGIHNGREHAVAAQEEARRAVKALASAGMWSTPLRSTAAAFNNGWNRRDHDENRSTTRSRPVSSGLGGTQVLAGSTSGTAQPQTHPSVVNCVGLPPLHCAPGKQPNGATLGEKEKSPTASTWDLMGFAYNPSAVAFGRAVDEISASKREFGGEHEGLYGNLSASEMEMRRQRRLRVFQEMTPTKTLQV